MTDDGCGWVVSWGRGNSACRGAGGCVGSGVGDVGSDCDWAGAGAGILAWGIAERIGRDVSVVWWEVVRKSQGLRVSTRGADVAAQRRRSRPKARKIDACPALGAGVLVPDHHRPRTRANNPAPP